MLDTIITSSLLIGLLILIRRLFRNKISRRLQYALWLLAAVHLLVPGTLFENPFHIMNRLPSAEQVASWTTEINLFSGKGKFTFQAETGTNEKQFALITGENSDAEMNASLKTGSQEADSANKPAPFNAANHSAEKQKTKVTYTPPHQEQKAAQLNTAFGTFQIGQLLRNIWYTGMAAMLLWTLIANLLCRRQHSQNRIYLGREGRVKIYVSEGTVTPCLLGIWHPVIYLSPGSIQVQKHKEYAIAHELTHYRHWDPIWNLLRSLCLILYWFHPLVWIGARLSARDCELACDEGVLHRLGEDKAQEYGCTLIAMAASFRRPWMLYCETALAPGKKELKERITLIASGKKHTCILAALPAIVCCGALAFCTFGKAAAAPVMGRYTETKIDLSEMPSPKEFRTIVQDGSTIRLVAESGFDLLSLDGGLTFEKEPFNNMNRFLDYPKEVCMTGTTGGTRTYRLERYSIEKWKNIFEHFLITENGEQIQLELSDESPANCWYSGGSIFVRERTDSSFRYYKLNSATGELNLLAENQVLISCLAASKDILYLVSKDDILLYNLKTDEIMEPDPVLLDFVMENAATHPWDWYPAVLYPYRDGTFILNHKGLYWYKLYGEKPELIIDGASCSIGNLSLNITGMCLLETEGEPAFLIQYNGTDLMRYTYNPTLPALQE